ncbi:MAG: adenine phosphoribosyltransferase [Alphaproteobacteria bacterium]
MSEKIDLKDLVRTIPDFPKPGIQFRDITSLIANGPGLAAAIEEMRKQAWLDMPFDAVAGIEARGFVFGAALAIEMGVGFIPIRKPGKLPGATIAESYELEYGTDTLEIHEGAVLPGQKILLVDDLIATGGTAEAAYKLLTRMEAKVPLAVFVIDLPDLGGANRLKSLGLKVSSLMAFEGD